MKSEHSSVSNCGCGCNANVGKPSDKTALPCVEAVSGSLEIASPVNKKTAQKIEWPTKNDETHWNELECDSPELNQMTGWNACHDAFMAVIEKEKI